MNVNESHAAATQPAVASSSPVPDALLSGLGRRFHGPALKVDVTLMMPGVRQIFRRDFVYVSHQIHALEASRRVQGLDRACLAGALRSVERRAEALQVQLLQLAAETSALVAQHEDAGAIGTIRAIGRPKTLQATIVSPLARIFVDILCLADDASAQVEKAWLLGLLDATARSARIAECRNAAIAFKHVVRQQRHLVGDHVREVNAARRALRASPSGE